MIRKPSKLGLNKILLKNRLLSVLADCINKDKILAVYAEFLVFEERIDKNFDQLVKIQQKQIYTL